MERAVTDEQPQLTVVIPAYNEEDTILRVLERVRAIPFSLQIIVVDDCSRIAPPSSCGTSRTSSSAATT